MRKDNTPNFQTPYSKLQHFRDFTQNMDKIKDELSKKDRQQKKDHDSDYQLPNEFRQNYNKVSSKYDSDSKAQIKDKIDSLKQETPDKPEHKYKFSNDEVNPNHFFKNETDVVESRIIKKFENFQHELGEEGIDSKGCGCCDDRDCSNDSDYSDDADIQYENDDEVKSYMFFGNLETIHRLSSELCQLDEHKVNDLLNQGHNWAEDHISVTKELISHVYNFLMNKAVQEHISVSDVEHGGGENYMFFANLENISKSCEEMMELDKDVVDELLENGHDWAEDHLAAAKEDIQQVYEWLKSELK